MPSANFVSAAKPVVPSAAQRFVDDISLVASSDLRLTIIVRFCGEQQR